jgi:hypothetical protein
VLGNSNHPEPVPGLLTGGELLVACYNACAAKSMSVSTTSAWVANRREIASHRAAPDQEYTWLGKSSASISGRPTQWLR